MDFQLSSVVSDVPIRFLWIFYDNMCSRVRKASKMASSRFTQDQNSFWSPLQKRFHVKKNRIAPYDFWSDTTGTFGANNCLNSYRYCQAGVASIFGTESGGVERLMEEGRQWCINEYGHSDDLSAMEEMYRYMVAFMGQCRQLDVGSWEPCSLQIMSALSTRMTTYVNDCMGQAAVGPLVNT